MPQRRRFPAPNACDVSVSCAAFIPTNSEITIRDATANVNPITDKYIVLSSRPAKNTMMTPFIIYNKFVSMAGIANLMNVENIRPSLAGGEAGSNILSASLF